MSALNDLLDMDASTEPNNIEEPEYHALVRAAKVEHIEAQRIIGSILTVRGLTSRRHALEQAAREYMNTYADDSPAGDDWIGKQ